jgi:hypothetical protein
MPRYTVALKLVIDADSMDEAAEMVDDLVHEADESNLVTLPPGDSSLTAISIQWPLD